MNSTWIRSSVFAAATLAFGTVSHAQAYDKVVADVKFNFRSTDVDHAAGKYDISSVRSPGGMLIFKLMNEDTRESVLLVGQVPLSGKDHSDARLVFRCNSVTCGLTEIWMGSDTGYRLAKPRLTPSEGERIAVVPLKTVHSNGD